MHIKTEHDWYMAGISRKNRVNTDYLVPGGGIAGVSALRECGSLGISAIGFEAASLIGGRIRTLNKRSSTGHPINLGAEFGHGDKMRELVQTVGLTPIKHPSDGLAYIDGEFHPLLPLLDILSDIHARAKAHLSGGGKDVTIERFITVLQRTEPELLRGNSSHLFLQLIRNDYASRVSELGVGGFLAPEVDGYSQNFRIKEGYSEFIRRLAEGTDLRTNHVVRAIIRHRNRVDVLTNRGVFSGNVAVVCLPVGVLQAGDVHFDPDLSKEKTEAIHSINPGMATKIALSFHRTQQGTTFWPQGTPLLATSLASQLWWPTGWGYDEGRHYFLSCLVGGAGTERFDGGDPHRAALTQLAHMFGRKPVFSKADAQHFVKSWHKDPYIKGGYSSIRAGTDHAAVLQELRRPEDDVNPQIVFGGEYVSEHPSTVHMARRSGIDAVHRAVNARGHGGC